MVETVDKDLHPTAARVADKLLGGREEARMLTANIPLPDFDCRIQLDRFHGQRNVLAYSIASGTQHQPTRVLFQSNDSREAYQALAEFKTRQAVIRKLTC